MLSFSYRYNLFRIRQLFSVFHSSLYLLAFQGTECCCHRKHGRSIRTQPESLAIADPDFSSGHRKFSVKALNEFRVAVKSWYDYSGNASRMGILILSPMPTLMAVTAAGIFFISTGTLAFPYFIALLMISTGMADAMMPLMWLNNFIKKEASDQNNGVYAVLWKNYEQAQAWNLQK